MNRIHHPRALHIAGILAGLWLCAIGGWAQWLGPGGEALEEESWRRSNGDFRAMLLISPDPDDFLREWAKPPSQEDPPNLVTTDTARRGDATGAFVLFQGCTAGEDGLCDATVDYEVTSPDGSVYARLEGADLWVGQPAVVEPTIQLGADYMVTIIEPEDPLGRYEVRAKLCDRLADRCLELSTAFEAVHRLEEFDLEEMVDGYYLDPRPDLVAQLIESAGADPARAAAFQPGGPIEGFLAEIFAAHPAEVAGWMQAVGQLDESLRGVFYGARELAQDPKTLILAEPPSPSQNDRLWGAYFASGDTDYLDGLLANVALAAEREDRNLFLCGSSAQWSLASNRQRHLAISLHLQQALASADDEEASAIQEILENGPEEFRRQTVEVIEERRKAGVW